MIEVGEYVRTKSGIIIKADFIDFEKLTIAQKGIGFDFEDIEEMEDFIKNDIVKHSKNVIDLIETGDIVELHKAYNEKGTILYHMIDRQYTESFTRALKEEHIVTILTEEQYEKNCYRLED